MGVLLAAAGVSVFFTATMARANGEPVWTRQARTILVALTPALVAGLVLTAIFVRIGHERLLPGVWMLLWGVGALGMSLFTPRTFSLLGVSFMVVGALTLFIDPGNDILSMGMSFGAIHLVYGIVLLTLRRPARAAELVFQD